MRIPLRKLSRLPRLIILVISSTILFFLIVRHHFQKNFVSSWIKDVETSKESASKHPRRKCQYPDLDPWKFEIAKFFEDMPPVVCDAKPNWVDVVDGRFIILPGARKRVGRISCKYRPFIRKTDEVTTEGAEIHIDNGTRMPCDFFRVSCVGDNGETYTNIHAGIHYNSLIHRRLKKPKTELKQKRGLGFDVIILGFDSVSRMQFLRKVPKTEKYFTNVLNGVTYKGFNILGDGTPQALIPMLTGKTEKQLPDVRKRTRSKLHVDVYPFVWRNFSDRGYVTAWSEDFADFGTFTYRLTGFKNQPTDHYMRVFHNLDSRYKKPLCLGDRPRVNVVMEWIKDFLKTYKTDPKFAFMFHSELSHDNNNLIQTADVDLVNFLKELKNEGYLARSILILMADHGARFQEQRKFLQGKQEERNPFFGLAFPPWFREKNPEAHSNIWKNSERLVTMFDVHETLMDVLDYTEAGTGNLSDRGISLFKEIPESRTCPDADIEAHWCNCLHVKPVETTDLNVLSAAHNFVEKINNMTHFKRDLCVELEFKQLVEAVKFDLTPEMLKFKKSKDADGYVPDMSDTTTVLFHQYLLKILTSPNNGLYEVTVKQDIKKNMFLFDENAISRINKYGDDPHCITATNEQLRKYCKCKDRL